MMTIDDLMDDNDQEEEQPYPSHQRPQEQRIDPNMPRCSFCGTQPVAYKLTDGRFVCPRCAKTAPEFADIRITPE